MTSLVNTERLHEFQTTPYELLPEMLNLIDTYEVGCNHYYSSAGLLFTGAPLEGFHPAGIRHIITKEDYYLGLRSESYFLLYGVSESLDGQNGDWGECVIVLANHKGNFMAAVYEFNLES